MLRSKYTITTMRAKGRTHTVPTVHVSLNTVQGNVTVVQQHISPLYLNGSILPVYIIRYL